MGRRGTGKGAQRGMMAPISEGGGGGERGKELTACRRRGRGEEEGIAKEDDE